MGDIARIEEYLDRHLPLLANSYKELARQSAVQSTAYLAGGAMSVVKVSPDNLDDHVEDLGLPAVVVVENDASDGCFLRAIAHVFGGQDILRAIERHWLIVGHGGGGDTYRRAEEEHKKFRRLRRVAVLFDSDRMAPGDLEKNKNRIDELRKRGIYVHVLQLREAENYLPNKLLRSTRPHRESSIRIKLLKQLSYDQRGHFDMKYGFGKTGGIPASQEKLFGNLSDRTIAGLMDGFGKDVIKLLAEAPARTLTEVDFENDVGAGVPDELRSIIKLLQKIV
jgi:hypothetical protein